MEKVVKTSRKNQITIPSWARKYLGIRSRSTLKLSSGVKGTQKCINITATPKRTSIGDIWDKIDQNTKKYGSDNTPETNAGPDMKDDE